jgi:hypothetical protein
MSHSCVSNLMHCTFSTKGRYPFIDSDAGITPLALLTLPWRHCEGKPNEGARYRRDHRSSARPFVTSGHDEFRQSSPIDKRRVVEMDK